MSIGGATIVVKKTAAIGEATYLRLTLKLSMLQQKGSVRTKVSWNRIQQKNENDGTEQSEHQLTET